MSNDSKALIIQVAEAVVAEITASADVLPVAVKAELSLVPNLELKDLFTLKAMVCPRSRKSTIISRNCSDKTLEIDIAVMKKARESEIPALLALVEALEAVFEGKKLTAMPDYRCVDVANEPVYVPEHLRQRQQFTSILTLTFKA